MTKTNISNDFYKKIKGGTTIEFLLSKKLGLTIYQQDQEIKTKQTFSNLRKNDTTEELPGLNDAMIEISGDDLEAMHTV